MKLLQGLSECRLLSDARGRRFALALLARRSRLHPGTRYIARGLNDAGSPGNEVECEQVVWLPDAVPLREGNNGGGDGHGDVGGKGEGEGEGRDLQGGAGGGFPEEVIGSPKFTEIPLAGSADPQQAGPQGNTIGSAQSTSDAPSARQQQGPGHGPAQGQGQGVSADGSGYSGPHWSSYVWRRGTVPIWWGAEIKSTVGEAEIFVSVRLQWLRSASGRVRICLRGSF